MNDSKQNFKGCIRTVKRVLKGDLCPNIFKAECEKNEMLKAAFICVRNKKREHLELSFKWYRKY